LTTFQEQSPDGGDSTVKPPKTPRREYLCGEKHCFIDCQYICKELKNDKWDSETQKEVDEKMKEAKEKYERLYEAVKKA
jgi:hypothetical protein